MRRAVRQALAVAIATARAPLSTARSRWPVLHRFGRPIRFGIVGVSGIILNTAIVWMLVQGMQMPIPFASALATEVAIVSNFLLNDQWTFRARTAHRSFRQRLLRFNSVALGGMAITTGMLTILTTYGRLPLLVANLLAIGGATAWNYIVNTRWTWRAEARQYVTLPQSPDPPQPDTGSAPRSGRILLGSLAILLCVLAGLVVYFTAWEHSMGLLTLTLFILSLLLFAQSLFSLYLMLYAWEHPERLAHSSGPRRFLPPQLSFTVLLPARHEEEVIYGTIKQVWSCNYPTDLLEVVVICHADDTGTIAEAQRAIREIESSQPLRERVAGEPIRDTRTLLSARPRVRVETFSGEPINKPRGLNVGLQRSSHQVVTVFDAEDDIDPDIFNVVNTVMVEEQTGIVQAGVQLINFRDHWFAIHNVLEYFFWFKSRLHFHASAGMIPLGGNTVFVRRDLLRKVGGWDERCLTEDADLGLRLSALGESIRVVYDAQHVTREETPDSVGAFVKQRTRWHQGFLQVLRKGAWRQLPKLRQRLLAVYTLSHPLLQAMITLLWPAMILAMLELKLPVPVTMVSFLPLYALVFQLLINIVGAWMFTREYRFKFPLLLPLSMAITFLPFQLLLGISAVRAVYREARKQQNWEKTRHVGAHRSMLFSDE